MEKSATVTDARINENVPGATHEKVLLREWEQLVALTRPSALLGWHGRECGDDERLLRIRNLGCDEDSDPINESSPIDYEFNRQRVLNYQPESVTLNYYTSAAANPVLVPSVENQTSRHQNSSVQLLNEFSDSDNLIEIHALGIHGPPCPLEE